MSPEYPLDSELATPEYVLEVFRDWHRHAATRGEADPDDPPTFDTRWGRFRDEVIGDVALWFEVARFLNAVWGVSIPMREWNRLLLWRWGTTVGDVCELIARHARRPVVRPWRYLAGECVPAGWFLTARSLLARAGADPSAVTPSAPVGPFLHRHGGCLAPLALAAPGRLPPTRRSYRPWRVRVPALLVLGPVGLLAAVLGPILLILGATTGNLTLAAVSAGLTAAGAGGLWWTTRLTAPTGTEFVGLSTFRDLAYALAGQEPRRRVQHSP
jgi:hypothetical protein